MVAVTRVIINDQSETDGEGFAELRLIGNTFALLVCFTAHAYLIDMALRMQTLFRQCGHVKGYYGEILIGLLYLLLLAYLLLQSVAKPLLMVQVYSDETFECSDSIRYGFAALQVISNCVWPLVPQMMFLSMIN